MDSVRRKSRWQEKKTNFPEGAFDLNLLVCHDLHREKIASAEELTCAE
jgi:hypothetical protein